MRILIERSDASNHQLQRKV